MANSNTLTTIITFSKQEVLEIRGYLAPEFRDIVSWGASVRNLTDALWETETSARKSILEVLFRKVYETFGKGDEGRWLIKSSSSRRGDLLLEALEASRRIRNPQRFFFGDLELEGITKISLVNGKGEISLLAVNRDNGDKWVLVISVEGDDFYYVSAHRASIGPSGEVDPDDQSMLLQVSDLKYLSPEALIRLQEIMFSARMAVQGILPYSLVAESETPPNTVVFVPCGGSSAIEVLDLRFSFE